MYLYYILTRFSAEFVKVYYHSFLQTLWAVATAML